MLAFIWPLWWVCAGVAAFLVWNFFFNNNNNNKPKVIKPIIKDPKKDMVYLFQFAPTKFSENLSPFTLKVETYLRLAGIEYEEVKGDHFSRAPKGKLPFIQLNGEVIGDSDIILRRLKEKFGDPLDKDLGERERGITTAVTRLIDEHLYWPLVHTRWVKEPGASIMLEQVLEGLSWPMRHLAFKMIQGKIKKSLYYQGLGLHSEDELYDFAEQDILALSQMLGDRNFFFSDSHPSTIDIVVYSMMYNIISVKIEGRLQKISHKFENLKGFVDRMQKLREDSVSVRRGFVTL